jgi:hypothetical protein
MTRYEQVQQEALAMNDDRYLNRVIVRDLRNPKNSLHKLKHTISGRVFFWVSLNSIFGLEIYCAVPKINLKKWVRGVDLCRLIEKRYLILL